MSSEAQEITEPIPIIQPPSRDPIEDKVDRPISGRGEEETIKASVDALNEKRRKEWESGIGPDDPFGQDSKNLTTDQVGNLNEVTAATRSFRELQAATLAQHEAQQEEIRQATEQLAAPVEAVAQPQAPQPQRDPVQAERQRLEAQRLSLAQLHQASIEEREAVNERVQIKQWLDHNCPPHIQTPEGLTWLQRNDPAHFQYLQQTLPQVLARDNQLAQGLQYVNNMRTAQQIQATRVQEQRQQQWREQQDGAFRRALETRHPQLAKDHNGMAKAAREYLTKDLGLTEQQLDYEWKYGALRSTPAQLLVADAVAHKMARASLKNVRKDLPPVGMSPGVARPRGSVDAADISSLERALDGATGDRAVRIAAELTRARRRAG